jgi:hypothetical protein
VSPEGQKQFRFRLAAETETEIETSETKPKPAIPIRKLKKLSCMDWQSPTPTSQDSPFFGK